MLANFLDSDFLVNNSLSGRVFFVSRIIAASSWPCDSRYCES